MKAFPKTLEQLREEQGKIFNRHESTSVTEVPKEYAEKIKKGNPSNQIVLSVDEILENVRTMTKRPQKSTPFHMSYGNARVVVWEICKLKSALQDRTFEVDENNKEIIQNLIRYFSGDPDCEWNLSKGLLLMGDVGLGKTYIMSVMRDYAKAANIDFRQFRLVGCPDIADEVEQNGAESLQKYFAGEDICFDDLGQEQAVIQRYGNNLSVMERILVKRYSSFVNGRCITHATTNLTPEEIEERYGTRLIDRFNEMFNYVFMTGESRRK